MIVNDFLNIIGKLAPPDLAADWDNCGLQVGDPDRVVTHVAMALDAASHTVQKALDIGCQLLITHHPMIFRPIKRLSPQDPTCAPVFLAASKNLAVISAHTNWDAVGVAQALASKLELVALSPLEDVGAPFSKLVVFVPPEHAKKVRLAAFEAGAGQIGDYPECFFQSSGLGGFSVPPWGKPFSGTPGKSHQTPEERLEIILPTALRGKIDRAVRAAHPYEEPALEYYELTTFGHGFGLLGRWDPPRDPVSFLSSKLPSNGLWAGPIPSLVSSVALMPGSGGDYVTMAAKSGAQLLITGDVNHHQALTATEAGLTVFSAGHFETERPGLERLAQLIMAALARLSEQIELTVLEEASPFRRL
ncbi:MAG: Nif3-like dinuclear metal center hexameric protein [Deltaproteobacteria bacterium]|jgi:dinuclear metal center YbgI/SA1388 family protein|nr:Nif3-like dinuclear metal center hexameric protein [Deltaproteobacteria bacterium]